MPTRICRLGYADSDMRASLSPVGDGPGLCPTLSESHRYTGPALGPPTVGGHGMARFRSLACLRLPPPASACLRLPPPASPILSVHRLEWARWMDGWLDGWMAGWKDRCMERWMDRWTRIEHRAPLPTQACPPAARPSLSVRWPAARPGLVHLPAQPAPGPACPPARRPAGPGPSARPPPTRRGSKPAGLLPAVAPPLFPAGPRSSPSAPLRGTVVP
jgi:hypothetical protein